MIVSMGQRHYIGPRAGPGAPVETGDDVGAGVADCDVGDADGADAYLGDPGRPDPAPSGTVRFTVPGEQRGWRLDRAIAAHLPSISRGRIQLWIEQGGARLNEAAARARDRVAGGDRVQIEAQEPAEAASFKPEPMALAIVYEDDDLIVVDKPPGLVVHPGAGNWSGTLLNGLLAHRADLSAVPRAGIVHRLDAGTSGLMVVAKTLAAQLDLVRQLQRREVVREYWAIVAGATEAGGLIDAALARDPRNPVRFRVSRRADARSALTRYRRIAVSAPAAGRVGIALSWLACRLDTGRTHQIRVHLESIGHPLVGDPVYSKHRPPAAGAALGLQRQALHACRLSLRHPARERTLTWFRPPPDDLSELMRAVGFDPARPVHAFDREARR
jgi:23S rRNA pseudouridine1911/1915/1917 synthase